MTADAFSGYHPAANMLWFAGAIGMGVVIRHPAYVIAGLAGAALYYLLLNGGKIGKLFLGFMLIFVLITFINPLFNTYGSTVLFMLGSRPYTFEALCYGLVTAGMFIAMLLWFACYSKVMTGDRFISLFGRIAPSLSLLLVMVIRMVPDLVRKGRHITGARTSIGLGAGDGSTFKEKLASGTTALSALTDRALEDSVITSDSMRARGYGTSKRSSFMIYRFTGRDAVMIILTAVLFAAVIAGGGKNAEFDDLIRVAPLTWAFPVYCVYIAVPSALFIKETITWRILRSGI